jgi:hypothetical protein
MGKGNERKRGYRSRRIATADIALGGLFEALSLGMLFLASVLPNMELTMPALAGILVYLMCRRSGFVSGAVFFAAGVLLALAIIPGKIALLPYFFCFGPYALLKVLLDGADGPWLFTRKNAARKASGSGMDTGFGIRLSDEREPGMDADEADGSSHAGDMQASCSDKSGTLGMNADKADGWPQAEDMQESRSKKSRTSGMGADKVNGSFRPDDAQAKSRMRRVVVLLLRYVLKLAVFAALAGIGILLFKTLFIENLALPDIATPLLAIGATGLFLMYDYILGLAQAMLGKYIRNR